jgi:hypothetical protein
LSTFALPRGPCAALQGGGPNQRPARAPRLPHALVHVRCVQRYPKLAWARSSISEQGQCKTPPPIRPVRKNSNDGRTSAFFARPNQNTVSVSNAVISLPYSRGKRLKQIGGAPWPIVMVLGLCHCRVLAGAREQRVRTRDQDFSISGRGHRRPRFARRGVRARGGGAVKGLKVPRLSQLSLNVKPTGATRGVQTNTVEWRVIPLTYGVTKVPEFSLAGTSGLEPDLDAAHSSKALRYTACAIAGGGKRHRISRGGGRGWALRKE